MRRFLRAPETLLSAATTDAKVEVIVVRVAAGRLMKNPSRAEHRFGRWLVARSVSEEAGLELVRAEEPFHARLVVHHQRAHEVPIARVIERKHAARHRGQAEAIEASPAGVECGDPPCVPDEEQQIRVASGSMATVPRVSAATLSRQVADAKWIPAGERERDCAGCVLDRRNQRGGPVAGALPRSQAPVALPSLGQRNRVPEVAAIGGPH